MNPEENIRYEIKENNVVGRYVVASCDLEAGEEILSEIPFAYGPKTDSPPVCLGCYALVDCSILCSTCGWPVCSEVCATAVAHKDGECQIFAAARAMFMSVMDTRAPCMQYECITPLRVLLAMERHRDKWEKEIRCLESHGEERKTQEIWILNQINVVNYLRGPCGLGKFSEELIQKVCGILDVNAFEARTISGNFIRCLYPRASIFSHNCVTNIAHSIFTNGYGPTEDYRIVVRSAISIKEGTELFARYAYSTWPTVIRRQFLRESKYFDCNCERCADPTELGTHMSTLKCSECEDGLVTSISPLDENSNWKCARCSNVLCITTVKKLFDDIQDEIDEVEGLPENLQTIAAMEALYKKYISVLHTRNAYLTIIRIALVQTYSKAYKAGFEQLPNTIYETKIELCSDILRNIDVIEPGYSRLRGIVLYEMYPPVFLLARNLYITGEIQEHELRERLEKSMELLKESSKILLLEPDNSNECVLGHFAEKTFHRLKSNFELIVNNIKIE